MSITGSYTSCPGFHGYRMPPLTRVSAAWRAGTSVLCPTVSPVPGRGPGMQQAHRKCQRTIQDHRNSTAPVGKWAEDAFRQSTAQREAKGPKGI